LRAYTVKLGVAMATAADRVEKTLTQTCRIERSAESQETTYLDMELGTWGLQARQRAVPCLLVPLSVSDDILAIGPVEQDRRRLFLVADADIEEDDQVTITDSAGTEAIWCVDRPPSLQTHRGLNTSIEAIVVRKAVQ